MIVILKYEALSLHGKDGCSPPESTSSVHIETCLGILWKGGLKVWVILILQKSII